jgi:hypothetical protein
MEHFGKIARRGKGLYELPICRDFLKISLPGGGLAIRDPSLIVAEHYSNIPDGVQN